jgi:hypothetical protein
MATIFLEKYINQIIIESGWTEPNSGDQCIDKNECKSVAVVVRTYLAV